MREELAGNSHHTLPVRREGFCRNVFRLAVLVAFLSLLSFFAVGPSEASEKAEVKDIHFWSSQGYTRVIVDLSRPVEFTKRRLSGPDRLFFDLRNSKMVKEIQKKLPVGDGILKAVRAGQYDADTVRIVLDLETMEDFNAFVLDDPAKLVIDVNAKKNEKHERVVTSQKVIVIDPGHGGHDSGACGPKGLKEKDVVLDIALKVRDILSHEPNLKIVLTRDRDVFIPLPERTLIALKNDADLFVSIHANASPRSGARGIETYLQNWTTEEEAIRVAARENYVTVKRMKEKMAQYRNDDVGKILSDLNRDYKRDESIALANYVQRSLYSSAAKVNARTINLGVKQAMFFVLMGANMPSILAEVSFISNPQEEKLLSTESYRKVLAASIAAGIKTYFSSSSPVQKMAEARSGGISAGLHEFVTGR